MGRRNYSVQSLKSSNPVPAFQQGKKIPAGEKEDSFLSQIQQYRRWEDDQANRCGQDAVDVSHLSRRVRKLSNLFLITAHSTAWLPTPSASVASIRLSLETALAPFVSLFYRPLGPSVGHLHMLFFCCLGRSLLWHLWWDNPLSVTSYHSLNVC